MSFRRVVRRCALAFAVLLATTAATQAQNVPPLQTPDVTTLLAPGDAGASDAGAVEGTDDNGTTDQPPPPPCGTQPISIARMAWPSAALLAEIHARVLKAQFDCSVQVLQSDLAPALSGMAATGQPAVAPEMWIARVADQWNAATKDQKLRQVGQSYAQSQFEGWYVPDYVAEEHPELKSAAALKDDWQLFAEGGKKAKFISCPADWACAVINRNLVKAEGLDGLFDVVEPKNRFDLDQTIAAAVSRKQPLLFYYWQPNATLAQFGFKPVDLGPFSKDDFTCLGKRNCADPKPSSFAPEPVVIALAQWVFTDAPEIAAYFQRAQMPVDEMDKLLAELSEPGATVESVADRFVAERSEVWQKWVGAAPSAAPAATPALDTGAAGDTTPSSRPTRPRQPTIQAPLAPANDSLPPPSLTQ
jgi:glycine betaine/proline transport system substrate-binding protein